jgi:hypothetical protein
MKKDPEKPSGYDWHVPVESIPEYPSHQGLLCRNLKAEAL